jgi:iron(III) transport system substrate-binding protein
MTLLAESRIPAHTFSRALKHSRRIAFALLAAALASCSQDRLEVVIYVAHDRVLSEPILERFQKDTGIRVRAVYDLEANKTVGLTNRLLAEADAPRADVFWNNEVIQTIRLQSRGVAAVEALHPPPSNGVPIADAQRRWIGFAARARVLLLNTRLVPASAVDGVPSLGLWDLSKSQWRNRAAIANPRFGTTGTHFAALLTAWGEPEFRRWLRALRSNGVAIMPGNAQVREAVASGQFALGLTDTDDAVEALSEGAPVKILFPDQDQQGTLIIPNTIALVAHRPHSESAERLTEYLLSSDVEASLARGRGAQLPLNYDVAPPEHLPPLRTIRAMRVDFTSIAARYEQMLSIVREEWPSDIAQTDD